MRHQVAEAQTSFESLSIHSDLAVSSAREAWKQLGRPRAVWLYVGPGFDQHCLGRLLEYWGGHDRPRVSVHTDRTLRGAGWYLETRAGRRVGSPDLR